MTTDSNPALIRDYAFYPDPNDPFAVGLLLAETPSPNGDLVHITGVVDGQHFQTWLSGVKAGAPLGGMEIHASRLLPQTFRGWPGEWGPLTPLYTAFLDGWVDLLRDGASWDDIHASAAALGASIRRVIGPTP